MATGPILWHCDRLETLTRIFHQYGEHSAIVYLISMSYAMNGRQVVTLRRVPGISQLQQKRHRPIVAQRHLHIRAKTAGGGVGVTLAKALQ